jgi:hypothetical protein
VVPTRVSAAHAHHVRRIQESGGGPEKVTDSFSTLGAGMATAKGAPAKKTIQGHMIAAMIRFEKAVVPRLKLIV